MKRLILIAALAAAPALAEDTRFLAPLPPAAQETLRKEMLDNLLALNEIITLLAENRVREAGDVAEQRLGQSAMGKNAALPYEARPGPQMPIEMHGLGRDGHTAASAFARAAASGDRNAAMAALPKLTASCVACHALYRTR
ncbi:cytochrome c [Azoarcus sp. L1K30]|uniref:cytochrome c n=1 Tax=Azoarcus sp. L1K30 TaxID=2820277 RepID=UPI001B820522|nr:cytochrome c [Azoarcus sp. L1K30]MBR0567106.1 cytochrome c [Azoarcus sp. L1K30]